MAFRDDCYFSVSREFVFEVSNGNLDQLASNGSLDQ